MSESGDRGDHRDDSADHHDDTSHDHRDDTSHDHGGDSDHDHGDDSDHDHHDLATVGAAVVTISTSRSLDDDPAGDAAVAAFEAAGHEIAIRELITDDYDGIQGRINSVARRDDVDCVVTSGGTGVTPDDVTIEAIKPLFDKELPGFGELFRRLSFEEIGTRVVATGATGGVIDGVPVFCLPGSENAVELGVGEIVVPEIGHLAGLATRDREE